MPSDPEIAPSPDAADLDLGLLKFLQTLTPAERLRRHESALQLVRALRKAGARHRGLDLDKSAGGDAGSTRATDSGTGAGATGNKK